MHTSALALSVSVAEYAALVWGTSAHMKQVDISFNEAICLVTASLKPTPIEKIYSLAGIAPSKIRREVAGAERTKQENDP